MYQSALLQTTKAVEITVTDVYIFTFGCCLTALVHLPCVKVQYSSRQQTSAWESTKSLFEKLLHVAFESVQLFGNGFASSSQRRL